MEYLSYSVTGKLFLEKFHDAIAEATKELVPYFEVLHVGFIERPCDANLVFSSFVLDARMKTSEKTEGVLLKKCFWMNKQLHSEIRSGNVIIFNFAKIGNFWASYGAKLIICIAFFCSKFMQCLEFRF